MGKSKIVTTELLSAKKKMIMCHAEQRTKDILNIRCCHEKKRKNDLFCQQKDESKRRCAAVDSYNFHVVEAAQMQADLFFFLQIHSWLNNRAPYINRDSAKPKNVAAGRL